jgi:rhodanese-related sulfurtransferase
MGDFLISIDDLAPLIGTPRAPRLLDVRERAAFDSGPHMLPAARWHDPTRPAEVDPTRRMAQDLVIYCSDGTGRSQALAARLRSSGIGARVLAGGLEGWRASGGILLRKAAVPGCGVGPTRWVTRIRPKIDRIACPWLIHRFIDPGAEFLFVHPEQVVAAAEALDAIPYDIEGVAFGHDGERCTFDTLLDRFGLNDPALADLALIVRGADTARLDLAAEAAGLLAVSLGNSAMAGGDDHRALALGFPVYDALLAWRRHAASETHNWPAKSR